MSFISDVERAFSAIVRGATQSVGNNVIVGATFNTVVFDNAGMWNAGTPTRLTCTKSGLYIITGSADWATNATGVRDIGLRVNGASFIAANRVLPNAAETTNINTAMVTRLVVGDFVELTLRQTSGAALDVVGVADYSPRLAVAYLGLA